jgi:hypothetical protein
VEFEVTDKLPGYIEIDFGLTPAATIAQRTPLGRWRVHSELVRDYGASLPRPIPPTNSCAVTPASFKNVMTVY